MHLAPEYVLNIKHQEVGEINFIHVQWPHSHNRQNPLNVFEALKHVFKLILMMSFLFDVFFAYMFKGQMHTRCFPVQRRYTFAASISLSKQSKTIPLR